MYGFADQSAEGGAPLSLSAASWIEQVPASYRRIRAAIAAVIAIVLGGWLAWTQFKNGILGQAESFWIFVILAVGAWRWRSWMAPREVRRFATVTVALGARERMRKAFPFWLLGFGGVAVIWPMQYHFDQLGEHWLAGVPFLLLGLVGTFIFTYAKTEKRLTPEAAKLKAHLEAQGVQAAQALTPNIDAISAKVEAVIELPLVRYPLAAFLLWFAYVSQEWMDRRSWIVAVAAVCWSLWLARELFGWVLGLAVVGGISWALFSGIAALPVSAAVVIGALLIAAAMQK